MDEDILKKAATLSIVLNRIIILTAIDKTTTQALTSADIDLVEQSAADVVKALRATLA